jgi:hypothetical protein
MALTKGVEWESECVAVTQPLAPVGPPAAPVAKEVRRGQLRLVDAVTNDRDTGAPSRRRARKSSLPSDDARQARSGTCARGPVELDSEELAALREALTRARRRLGVGKACADAQPRRARHLSGCPGAGLRSTARGSVSGWRTPSWARQKAHGLRERAKRWPRAHTRKVPVGPAVRCAKSVHAVAPVRTFRRRCVDCMGGRLRFN